ncbi:MAG: hypothetical protein ABW170_21405 [Candidatus Thiodiazotropha sp. L084R]
MILKINKWTFFFLLVFVLQACGGGGDDGDGGSTNTSLDYSGETKQASLTTENVDQLSTAAASGSKQAISSDNVPVIGARADMPVTRQQINEELSVLIGGALSRGSQLAARGDTAARTEDISNTMCDSGSVIIEYPGNGVAGNWSIEFNQCTTRSRYGNDNHSTIFDGSVEGTYVQVGNGYRLTLNYVNFSVEVTNSNGSYTDTFNMSVTCTSIDQEGINASCEYHSDYRGYDNRTYRVSEVTVSGNDSSGYQISVRVYDPDHGYVLVTTEVPVTFDCEDGHPSAGRIRFEGVNGTTAVIEFISCTQYVVTFEGVAETYSWP